LVYDKFNLFLDLVGVGTLSTPTCATDKFKATTSFGHKSDGTFSDQIDH